MKPGLLLFAALSLQTAFGQSLMQRAPARAANTVNPLRADERAEKAGAKLYARECSACHGARRQGQEGIPPLNGPDVQGAAPGVLFWILRNGALHNGMPSFAHLPEEQRWQIVTFLKGAGK